MVFIKNPICGHVILSNPDYQQISWCKRKLRDDWWKILRDRPFMCLDCADEHRLLRRDSQCETIKLEKTQYNKRGPHVSFIWILHPCHIYAIDSWWKPQTLFDYLSFRVEVCKGIKDSYPVEHDWGEYGYDKNDVAIDRRSGGRLTGCDLKAGSVSALGSGSHGWRLHSALFREKFLRVVLTVQVQVLSGRMRSTIWSRDSVMWSSSSAITCPRFNLKESYMRWRRNMLSVLLRRLRGVDKH